MSYSETEFVRQYEPGNRARVELRNGRIVDVIEGRYYDAGTTIVLHGGKIESIRSGPGPGGEPAAVTPDYDIDLQGKTVLPGLFNTHIHGPESSPATVVPSLSEMLAAKRHNEEQLVKNLADCLTHGVTNVRHAGFVADLRANRALKERIRTGELPGPRILQAVVVGPTGSYMQEKLPVMMTVMAGMPQVDPSKDYAGAVAFPLDATEDQVRAAVDIAIDERGAEVIKIGDETFSMLSGKPVPVMSIEQLSILVDQARRRGLQSTMHHSSVESFRRGVQAGVSTLEHVPWDAPLTREDVEAFKAAGCLNDPTISVFYGIFSWKLVGGRSNDHPELNRLTAFRDRTYPFATIADEFYIPELRASVVNSYRRCASGKPKMAVDGLYPQGCGIAHSVHFGYDFGRTECPAMSSITATARPGELMEYLEGGRSNQIARIGGRIRRPAGAWTPHVHSLLHHLRSQGFSGTPEPIGLDAEGHEIISYIAGQVSNYPLSEAASSMNALISSAELLREYHDATESFLSELTGNEPWLLPAREPVEVICHGDYAPYNVVLDGDQAIALIDFDTAHPGPRVWDIAYALYRWSPLTSPNNADGFGSEQDKVSRCRLFCDVYGLSEEDRVGLMSIVIERLQVLVEFMQSEAEAGNSAFQANIADGHHLTYLADIEYLQANGERIEADLL